MNSKKRTSWFLAMLMLVSNVGLAFNVHYCEGKIASVTSVYNTEEVCDMPDALVDSSCCANTGTSDHEDCCKDKLVDLQDKSDDVVIKTFSFQSELPFTFPVWRPLAFAFVVAQLQTQQSTYYCEQNTPPLFKLYSRYIFYA